MRENRFIQNKANLFTTVVVTLACICAFVQMYAIPHRNNLLMMLANRAMMFMWLGTAVFLLLKNGVRHLVGTVLMLLMTVLAFVISIWDPTNQSASTFSLLLNFMVFPLMLLFFAYCEVSDFTKQILLFTNIALSLLFIYLSRTRMAYRFDGPYLTIYTGDLTLGYPNPNQAAIYLFICAMNLIVGFFYFEKKILKLFCIADFAYMVILMEKTRSRTSILLIVTFIVLVILHRIPKALVTAAVLVPLFYVLAARMMPFFKTMKIMGETIFNGRDELYERYFNNLNGFTFMFGDFAEFRFENLHNAYISIAATAGILALLLYIRMLSYHILQNHKLGIHKGYETVAFIGFLCVILYSSAEAAGLLGGTNYAFMNISLFAYFSKPFARRELNEPL